MLGKYQSNSGMDDWIAAKKVMRYLHITKDHMLMYGKTDDLEVVAYLDFTRLLIQEIKIRIHIYICRWSYILERCKEDLGSASIIEAKFISCVRQLQWLTVKTFISGLRIVNAISKQSRVYCNCFLAKNNKSRSQSKHVEIKYLAITERAKQKKKVVIQHMRIEFIIVDL